MSDKDLAKVTGGNVPHWDFVIVRKIDKASLELFWCQASWSRYPLIIQGAARIKDNAIIDAEVVWLDPAGVPNFEALHSRANDARATALAFDLLMINGEDLRRAAYIERKAALRQLLRGDRGIQYVEHAEGHGDKLFKAVCKLGLRALFRRNWMRPIAQENRKAG